MKDSLKYLYTKAETSYADLLKVGYAAEIESAKGRALCSKAAALKQEELVSVGQRKSDSTSKQVDQMVTKIEELTTIVKSAQYSSGKKNIQKSQKNSQLQVHRQRQSLQTRIMTGKNMLESPCSVGIVEVGGMSYVSAPVQRM